MWFKILPEENWRIMFILSIIKSFSPHCSGHKPITVTHNLHTTNQNHTELIYAWEHRWSHSPYLLPPSIIPDWNNAASSNAGSKNTIHKEIHNRMLRECSHFNCPKIGCNAIKLHYIGAIDRRVEALTPWTTPANWGWIALQFTPLKSYNGGWHSVIPKWASNRLHDTLNCTCANIQRIAPLNFTHTEMNLRPK